MRSLAEGGKDYESFAKLLKSKFVFLNVYCTSVADEKKPRGPEGPYQFVDRSVPVYVIKDWSGQTFKQQLGYGSGKAATLALASHIEDAVKKNGPISPPKNLKALNKIWDKAHASFDRKRPGYGWKELEKLMKAARDRKKFRNGLPTIAKKAEAKISALDAALTKEIEAAMKLATQDPGAATKSLKRLLRTYGMVKSAKARLKASLKKVSKAAKG